MKERNSRLARLLEMIMLVQSGEHWGPGRLAKHFGISKTRLYQDIKELSKAGIPLSYTGSGYQIDESFFLPALNLTIQEIFLLLYPEYQFRSAATKSVQETIQAKLLGCLPPHVRKFFSKGLERTYIKPEATTEYDEIFEQIHHAVAAHLKTIIDYRSLEADDYEQRAIDPLGLAYRNHSWYLVALCHKREEIRTFKLNRIRKAAVTRLKFQPPADFKLPTYFEGKWGVFDGKKERVVIQFSPLAARLVENKPPVQNGSFMEFADGSARFTGTVRGAQEIVWWILKYGDQAEILEPEHLREEVKQIVAGMAKKYGLS